MHRVDPSVHLLAETQINYSNVEEWLKYSDADFFYEDETSGVEEIIEFGSRSCYQSFAKRGTHGAGEFVNPNLNNIRVGNAPHIANIIKQGHGSVLEHAWVTFGLRDISRVTTAELTRHRVGVAISQESLRYVRVDDIGLWIPSCFADIPAAVAIFEGIFRRDEAAYQQLLELAAIKETGEVAASLEEFQHLAFHDKKEYTSGARRILPMGIATNMVWSANMRTVRHCIEMRTNPGAEEEIRILFGEIAKIVIVEFPNIFADYTTEEVNGILWYKTKYSKV